MSILKTRPLLAQHTNGRNAHKERGTLTSSRAFKAAGVRAPTSGNAAEWADWQLNPARSPTGTQPERAASSHCCSQRGLFA